jgi:hypothetical protein
LALEDLRSALLHTYSYLQFGGVFRFVLPDLEALAREYLESQDAEASYRFMEKSHLGLRRRPRGLDGLIRSWLGNSLHLWMWDFRSMAGELERVGFKQVRRAQFGDSIHPWFAEVEDKERWEACLGIECVK